jgi:hypothetical protein
MVMSENVSLGVYKIECNTQGELAEPKVRFSAGIEYEILVAAEPNETTALDVPKYVVLEYALLQNESS